MLLGLTMARLPVRAFNAIIALVLTGLSATASPIKIRPLMRGTVANGCDGTIQLRKVCDTCSDASEPRPFGQAEFDIASDAKWQVVLASSRCWAPILDVEI